MKSFLNFLTALIIPMLAIISIYYAWNEQYLPAIYTICYCISLELSSINEKLGKE